MFIDLDSFDRELPIKVVVPAVEIDLENENLKLFGELWFDGKAVKGSASVIVGGRLSGHSEVACDRCLSAVKRTIEIEFEDVFISKDMFSLDREKELAPADLAANEFEGNSIDLNEVIREQILLDAPQQLFCRKDCKGLCQKCGANLNLIDCKCEKTELDPRWAALKDLN